MKRGLAARLCLLAASVGLVLLAGEATFRILLPDRYHVWPPGLRRSHDVAGEYLPGVSGPSAFTINGEGMRGESWDDAPRYRILAVGGSTTICAMLDDADAWPRVVQQLTNAALGEDAVYVGNVGRLGHSTPLHTLQVEKLLEQYGVIDAVLALVGVNDMLFHLNALTGSLELDGGGPADPEQRLRRAFSVVPVEPEGPWYAWSALATRLRAWGPAAPAGGWLVLDAGGAMVREQRLRRQQATRFIDALPDLSGVLRSYGRSLERIVDVARARNARPILLTQPSLWREGLAPEVEARLWIGGGLLAGTGDEGAYFSVRALAEAMAAYNRKTLEVCAARDVECIDLAGRVPRDAALFWDDIHFSERGARRVAELVTDHLLATPPLSAPTSDPQQGTPQARSARSEAKPSEVTTTPISRRPRSGERGPAGRTRGGSPAPAGRPRPGSARAG